MVLDFIHSLDHFEFCSTANMSNTTLACSDSNQQSTSSAALNSSLKTMSPEQQELPQHPLFNLAIVGKVQQKIPLMNKFVLLVGERYSRLKSGSGLIGHTMDQMEQQMFSIAANLVQLVPKQPVAMVDQVACQGLDLIENQVVSLAQTTKEVKDRIMDAPHVLVEKVSRLNNSDPVYSSLDLALTILERTLDRYWPVEHDQSKHIMGNSTESNGIKSSGGVLHHIIPVDRLIKRIRQFSQHIRIHLVDLAKSNRLLGRVIIVLSTFLVQPIPIKPSDTCDLLVPPITDVEPPIKDESMNNINGPPYIVEIGKLEVKEKTPEKLNGDLPINQIDVSNETKAKKSPLSNGNNNLQSQQIQPQNNQFSPVNVAATGQKSPSESDSIYEQQVMDIVNRIVNKDEPEIEPKPSEQNLPEMVPENNFEQSFQVGVQSVEQLPIQDGFKEQDKKNELNKKN